MKTRARHSRRSCARSAPRPSSCAPTFATKAEVRNLIDRAVARFGRIDVAVNNAGTEGELGPIIEQSAANYEATFAVNVLGTLLSLKHEMRVMLPQGSGSIINLSSIARAGGLRGRVGLCGQQACRRRPDQERRARGRRRRRTGERGGAGPVDTQMLDRFVGGSERGEGALPGDDSRRARQHDRKRSRRPSCFSPATRRGT